MEGTELLPVREDADIFGVTERQMHGVVELFERILRSVDAKIDAKVLDGFNRKFEQHFQQGQQELRSELEGCLDTVVIQHQLMRSKQKLIDMCFSDIVDYYQDKAPEVCNAIKSIKELHLLPWGEEGSKTPRVEHHLTVKEPLGPFEGLHRYLTLHWWLKYLLSLVPIVSWLPRYSLKRDFLGDLQAGLTVGFIVIPQGLSYASLAGMPPVYGLYTAFIPSAMYTFFGSSNEITVGPVAMVSLTLPSVLSSLAEQGTSEYIMYALVVALISGGLLLAFGLLRLGFLIENLISYPTMMGFTQGAACLIILGQFKGLLNIPISPTAKTIIDYMSDIVKYMPQASWQNFIFGTLVVVIVTASRLYERRIPMAFLMLVLTTFIAWAARLDLHGIPLVGSIPSGVHTIPTLSVSSSDVSTLMTGAAIIALLGFMETITVGKRFALVRHYSIRANSELVALGMANLIGACFCSYPATGSVSRTSENYWNNSKSPLNGIIVSIVILCTLLFATSLFYWTPKCVLSAVVIAAAGALIEWKGTEIRFLWKMGEYLDIAQILIVWIGALLLGPEWGVVIAVIVTLVQVLYRASRPSMAVLGRLFGSYVYRDTTRYPEAITIPGVLIVRLDARMAFFNISWFADRLSKLDRGTPDLRVVILNCAGINSIDSTAVHTMFEVVSAYEKRGIPILWADVKGTVRDVLDASGLTSKIGLDKFFLTVHDAVEYAQSIANVGGKSARSASRL